jgi:hypothetical protein
MLLIVLISLIQKRFSSKIYTLALCFVVFGGNLNLIYYIGKNYRQFARISTSGWHDTKTVPLKIMTTDSGLNVFIPKSGDQVWDSPIPSTPYFNPNLKLLDENSMSAGFTIGRLKDSEN